MSQTRLSALLLLTLLSGCGLRPSPQASTSPQVFEQKVLPEISSPSPSPVSVSSPLPISLGFVVVEAAVPTRNSNPVKSPSVLLTNESESNLALQLPGAAKAEAINDPVLEGLVSQAESEQSAASWRQVAERAVILGDFERAQQSYSKEADIYEHKGQVQASLAERAKATQYTTTLELYQTAPVKKPAVLERLEPASGCYVGAFIDRDDTLEKHQFDSQIHGDIPQFNELAKKKHASFFMYRAYGQAFPTKWAEYVKEQGAIPHIAWEPSDLSEVTDDAYLNEFVAAAQALDHPVLLRFASEMNGEWTAYHGNPEAYKRAFRMVHSKTRVAPKVALLWCVNTVPKSNIGDYYPGDQYVDWVGVNFYSVPFLDSDPKRSGEAIHPTEQLQFVYDNYASKKPIAIGEWAASQQSILTDRNLEYFAAGKLGQLYSSLPTRFPRVKMVNWYDCNNIRQARDARKLNNFQITNSAQLLESYVRAVSASHYLGAGQDSSTSSYKPVKAELELKKTDELRLFSKSYDPVLRIYFHVAGAVIHASDDPLEWFISGEQLAKYGKGELKIFVYDSKNRFVTRSSVRFKLLDS